MVGGSSVTVSSKIDAIVGSDGGVVSVSALQEASVPIITPLISKIKKKFMVNVCLWCMNPPNGRWERYLCCKFVRAGRQIWVSKRGYSRSEHPLLQFYG